MRCPAHEYGHRPSGRAPGPHWSDGAQSVGADKRPIPKEDCSMLTMLFAVRRTAKVLLKLERGTSGGVDRRVSGHIVHGIGTEAAADLALALLFERRN